MAEFQLGSISTGTLRTEDLLPAFAYTLGALAHNPISNTSVFKSESMAEIWQGAIDIINTPDDIHLDIHEVIDELQDALQEYCPTFVYFGTLEGDGADFGFWPDRDALDEALTRHDVPDPDRDGCQVLEDDGVIVQISDHGNVTVMDLERNVIWSVV